MSTSPPPLEEARTAPWWLVVGLLLAVPAVLAATLSAWLGVPEERVSPESVLARFSLPTEGIEKARGLEYADLVFLRLQLTQEGVERFEAALEGTPFESGPAGPPVTLKVERDWWDPPAGVEGRTWEFEGGQLFRPESDRRQVFLVALRTRSGESTITAPEGPKTEANSKEERDR